MAAIKFTDATKAYPRTIAPAGKYPIVGDRIYATLKDAQDYVDGNSSSKSAIPGITLSVISDGKNNGAYWVAQAAGYENATKGILIKYSQGGETSSTLAGLLDVQVSSPSNGQAIVYDSASGMWMNKTIEKGNDITSQSIISALGYTPFDSDAFTKSNIKNALGIADWALASTKPSYTWTEIRSRPTALSEFTNDLGLGSLAYKSSLVASDIPSLSWSKITSGKPTTLSGYGITDAIGYNANIDLASDYKAIGYGYADKGWKGAGPAMVFGTALYNLRMQLTVDNTDRPRIYASQMFNGEAKGWAELITYEGVAVRYLDTAGYLIDNSYALHRSGNETFVNYGHRTTDTLYLYGNDIRMSLDGGSSYQLALSGSSVYILDIGLTKGASGSLKAGAYEALQYYADAKLIMHRNAGASNFYLNYGGAGEPLYAYASEFGFHIGASRERAFTIAENKDASFNANLTVAGSLQVNGTSRFVSLATFDNGLKIGDATLTWDASAGMLKIDKGVYIEGAITAKKKA